MKMVSLHTNKIYNFKNLLNLLLKHHEIKLLTNSKFKTSKFLQFQKFNSTIYIKI